MSALPWPNTDISYSIVPDGTSWNTSGNSQNESVWFEKLNGLTNSETWQRYVATAFQAWANHSNLNFHRVNDDGVAFGRPSSTQGNIRIGSIDVSGADGWASSPLGGHGGDITIKASSSILSEKYWSETRFISLLTHEIGHALGLRHSDVLGTVMGGNRTPFIGLETDDVEGIQTLYGEREHDPFDKEAPNDSVSTASQLQFDSAGRIDVSADLTSHVDVDYYQLSVPVGGESFTVSADARQLSLLAPKVQVFDAGNNLVAEASGDYGTVATVRLDGLKGGETYTVVVDGASEDVFGMGAYRLDVDAVVTSPAAEPIANPEPVSAPNGDSSVLPPPTDELTNNVTPSTPATDAPVESNNKAPTPLPIPVIPPGPADSTPTASDDSSLAEVTLPSVQEAETQEADLGRQDAEVETREQPHHPSTVPTNEGQEEAVQTEPPRAHSHVHHEHDLVARGVETSNPGPSNDTVPSATSDRSPIIGGLRRRLLASGSAVGIDFHVTGTVNSSTVNSSTVNSSTVNSSTVNSGTVNSSTVNAEIVSPVQTLAAVEPLQPTPPASTTTTTVDRVPDESKPIADADHEVTSAAPLDTVALDQSQNATPTHTFSAIVGPSNENNPSNQHQQNEHEDAEPKQPLEPTMLRHETIESSDVAPSSRVVSADALPQEQSVRSSEPIPFQPRKVPRGLRRFNLASAATESVDHDNGQRIGVAANALGSRAASTADVVFATIDPHDLTSRTRLPTDDLLNLLAEDRSSDGLRRSPLFRHLGSARLSRFRAAT